MKCSKVVKSLICLSMVLAQGIPAAYATTILPVPIEEQVVEVPVIQVSVEVDKKLVVFEDQEPIITTLVPVRGIFESIGYTVEWDRATETALIYNDIYKIVIKKGKHYFTNNGIRYNLDIPAQIINGRFMLPPKPVLESIGYSSEWDNDRNVVIVSKAN